MVIQSFSLAISVKEEKKQFTRFKYLAKVILKVIMC